MKVRDLIAFLTEGVTKNPDRLEFDIYDPELGRLFHPRPIDWDDKSRELSCAYISDVRIRRDHQPIEPEED